MAATVVAGTVLVGAVVVVVMMTVVVVAGSVLGATVVSPGRVLAGDPVGATVDSGGNEVGPLISGGSVSVLSSALDEQPASTSDTVTAASRPSRLPLAVRDDARGREVVTSPCWCGQALRATRRW